MGTFHNCGMLFTDSEKMEVYLIACHRIRYHSSTMRLLLYMEMFASRRFSQAKVENGDWAD